MNNLKLSLWLSTTIMSALLTNYSIKHRILVLIIITQLILFVSPFNKLFSSAILTIDWSKVTKFYDNCNNRKSLQKQFAFIWFEFNPLTSESIIELSKPLVSGALTEGIYHDYLLWLQSKQNDFEKSWSFFKQQNQIKLSNNYIEFLMIWSIVWKYCTVLKVYTLFLIEINEKLIKQSICL